MTIKKEIKFSKIYNTCKLPTRSTKDSIGKVNAKTLSSGVVPNNILKTFVCGLI